MSNNNQNQGGQVVSLDDIQALIGINPLTTDRSATVLQAVIEKIQQENSDKAQAALEKEVRELVGLVQDKNKIVNEFTGKTREFDKKIAKIYNKLNGVKNNKPVQDDQNGDSTSTESVQSEPVKA